MAKTFEEFYEILKQDRRFSTWSAQQTFEKRYNELADEVEELKLALSSNNPKEIEDELGDVLWDTLFLLLIAEEKGYCSVTSVLKNSVEKLKRRKPWIFEGKIHPIEYEEEYWVKAKAEEKRVKLLQNNTNDNKK